MCFFYIKYFVFVLSPNNKVYSHDIKSFKFEKNSLWLKDKTCNIFNILIQQESKTLKLKKVFCKYPRPCLDFMNRDLLMEELLKITNTLPPSLI